MSVAIRLQRRGKKHKPFYNIVATDSRSARDGKFIEKLGFYDASPELSVISIDQERTQYWYSNGAQLSNQVANLLKIKNITVTRGKTHK